MLFRAATMKLDQEEPHLVQTEKTSWFKSPLASDRLRQPSAAPNPFNDESAKRSDHLASDEGSCYDGYPPFRRYEEPTLLEILYDLFFAANYNVFAQNQSVTNHERFKAYVGYFSLLWGTWFVVTMYDVRYVTDSIFERLARAIQLGVLVGFTVVAPNFDPEDQSKATMQTMSLILCVSRACLAIEYTHTLSNIYKYKRARRPLYLQIAINLICAAVYFGITFRFERGNSRVYVTWYIFAAGEAILTLLISNYWKTLSFTRTHLMKRLSLITVMILGEGIQSVAQNIAVMVKTPAAWNGYTIGIITAASGTIYCIFLVYFDWMRQLQLPPLRQQIWTALHYPFHLSLVLFMQGFTQLILYGKAFNVFDRISTGWVDGLDLVDRDGARNITSQEIAESLTNKTSELFTLYPPKYPESWAVVNSTIANISRIDNALWANLSQIIVSGDLDDDDDDAIASLIGKLSEFLGQVAVITLACANSVFNSFNIDLTTEVKKRNPGASNPIKAAESQVTIGEKTQQRSRLIFAYTYIACGCTLALLVAMALVSRMTPVGRWPRLRFVVCLLTGVGIGVTAILFYAPDTVDRFLSSPWPIPVLLFAWFAATVLVHIRGGRCRIPRDTFGNIAGLFRPRKTRRTTVVREEDEVEDEDVPPSPRTVSRENTDLSTTLTLSPVKGAAEKEKSPV